MSLILYLSKTIAVSGFLYFYYWLFLRNKQFHQYNRFYLLSIPLLSLIVPLFRIPVHGIAGGQGLKLLNVITGNWEDAVVITAHQNGFQKIATPEHIAYGVYIFVAGLLTGVFLRSLFYVMRISRKYVYEKIDDIRFFQTSEPGTPFSFMKNIFWNRHIEMQSKQGEQVLRHELYHVRQGHTADILFLELAVIGCWFNPFFHLVKKEIRVIHEFLADQYAASESNRYDYAELLLWQSMSNKQFKLANPFFHNQIKRRIAMITKFKNTRYGYISRIMVLPLLFILFCAFGVKLNGIKKGSIKETQPVSVFYTVPAIDAADALTPVEFKNLVAQGSGEEFQKYFFPVIDSNNPKPFTKVEVEAEYPGGQAGWMDYLNKNLKYPQKAVNKEIQGLVLARFIVNADGTISDIKILKSPDKSLSDAALAAIRNSGKWIPAEQKKHIVASYKKQPIIFKLEAQ